MQNYWRAFINGLLLRIPKTPSNTCNEILLMVKKEKREPGKAGRSLCWKVSFNHLNLCLPLLLRPGITILGIISSKTQTCAWVCFISKDLAEECPLLVLGTCLLTVFPQSTVLLVYMFCKIWLRSILIKRNGCVMLPLFPHRSTLYRVSSAAVPFLLWWVFGLWQNFLKLPLPWKVTSSTIEPELKISLLRSTVTLPAKYH